MGENLSGGILKLLGILKDHWGAAERDLTAAGYTFDDVGTERFPFSAFVHFIVYAPPGTALFHLLSDGWTPECYLLADLIDIGMLLLWSKTEDGHDNKNRPGPRYRPGMNLPKHDEQPPMTIGDYMKLAGLEAS